MAVELLTIKDNILIDDAENIRRTRDRLDKRDILAVKVMSSPGGGQDQPRLANNKRTKVPNQSGEE